MSPIEKWLKTLFLPLVTIVKPYLFYKFSQVSIQNTFTILFKAKIKHTHNHLWTVKCDQMIAKYHISGIKYKMQAFGQRKNCKNIISETGW